MKKQTLVSNRRDQNLLILLIVVIIGYLLYAYVMTPQLEKSVLLKDALYNAETQLADAVDVTERYSQMQKEESQLRETISEKYSMFFYDINQERILYRLDTLMINAGLPVERYANSGTAVAAISFVNPAYEPLSYPMQDLAAVVNPSVIPEPPVPVGQEGGEVIPTTDITIDFTGAAYEAAITFLRAVEGMDKSVIVRNVALSRAREGAGLDGQLILAVYSLPQIDDSQKDLLKFLPAAPKGKPNPFS